MAEGDGIDVNLNWDFSSLATGIGSSFSSAGESMWEGAKDLTDESAGALIGVLMIVAAGLVIWRITR